MEYIKIQWHNDEPDYPKWLFSELNDERFETRKIEVFADGRHSFANADIEQGGVRLSTRPLPPNENIDAQPEFSLSVIGLVAFEAVWRKAIRQYKDSQTAR